MPLLLCEFQREHPGVRIALTVADTQAVVERVAARELELGIVGAARRHRAVAFEPFFDDEVILACPPGHAFAGRTVSLEELRGESLIVMQEGAGVRQIVEDELRSVGHAPARPRRPARARAAGVGAKRRPGRLRRHVHLALGGRAGAGGAARSPRPRSKGSTRRREISLARASGRTPTRAADAFVEFARAKLAA